MPKCPKDRQNYITISGHNILWIYLLLRVIRVKSRRLQQHWRKVCWNNIEWSKDQSQPFSICCSWMVTWLLLKWIRVQWNRVHFHRKKELLHDESSTYFCHTLYCCVDDSSRNSGLSWWLILWWWRIDVHTSQHQMVSFT